jgi:protein involved in polysaccharide export with SLBB domain
MSMALISRVVLLLPVLLGAACRQIIPKPGFDARKVDQTVANLTFTNIKIKRALDPRLLIPPKETYILGPGDVLEIEIAGVPGTLASTFVMPDGMVYYNLAGGVRAEDLTQAAFAKQLTEALKRDYTNPLVNVSLVEVRSRRYWILGQVLKPGIFPLRQPTTLLEAVAQAGGLAMSGLAGTSVEIADLGSSVIIRDGDMLPVNFEKLIKAGDTSQNIYLRHNDFIFLPSSNTTTVLLLGAVAAPQAIRYKETLTLVDCIAQGKGPAKEACLDQIVVVRGSLKKPQSPSSTSRPSSPGSKPTCCCNPATSCGFRGARWGCWKPPSNWSSRTPRAAMPPARVPVSPAARSAQAFPFRSANPQHPPPLRSAVRDPASTPSWTFCLKAPMVFLSLWSS